MFPKRPCRLNQEEEEEANYNNDDARHAVTQTSHPLIEISIHKPSTDNCGGLTIEPNTIKHVEKGHVTHVCRKCGSAAVNKPDRDDQNNTKCVQKKKSSSSSSSSRTVQKPPRSILAH